MATSTMQGVYPILVTPFSEDSQIDEESLRTLIDFNLDAGVHGLGVALGSEVYKLTEAERAWTTRVVVDQVDGRVPVVINTGANGTDLAVHYSRMAHENGADALMVLPPSFFPAGPAEDTGILPRDFGSGAAADIHPGCGRFAGFRRPGAAARGRVRVGPVHQGREFSRGGKGGGDVGGSR